jgi:predicted nuclease with TOPRIM domain
VKEQENQIEFLSELPPMIEELKTKHLWQEQKIKMEAAKAKESLIKEISELTTEVDNMRTKATTNGDMQARMTEDERRQLNLNVSDLSYRLSVLAQEKEKAENELKQQFQQVSDRASTLAKIKLLEDVWRKLQIDSFSITRLHSCVDRTFSLSFSLSYFVLLVSFEFHVSYV